MAFTETASAPAGYVAFCRQQPAECGAPAPSAEPAISREIVALAALAQTSSSTTTGAIDDLSAWRTWGMTRASGAQPTKVSQIVQPVPAQPEMIATGLISLAPPEETDGPAGEPLLRIDISQTMAELAKTSPIAQDPDPAALTGAPNLPPLQMTPKVWRALLKVNDTINRAIAQRTDQETYGVAELWTLPLENGARFGDCEDYVLEKRRALISEGLPHEALSIAVVITSKGESHAVLVASTDKGDYVLDSLTPWVTPWEKTGYTWRERQVAGSTSVWAMVRNNIGSPSDPKYYERMLLASLH